MASTARAAADGGVVVSSVRSTAASMSCWVRGAGAVRCSCHWLAASSVANTSTAAHKAYRGRLDGDCALLCAATCAPPLSLVVDGGGAAMSCAGGNAVGVRLLGRERL